MRKLIFSFFLLMAWSISAQTPGERLTEALNNYDYKLALSIVQSDTVNTDPEWKFQHANILKSLSRYNEAIDVLLAQKEADPSLRVLVELMNCCSMAGDQIRSLSFCQEALLLNPDNNFLKIREANLFFDMSEYALAYICYDSLYRQDSTLLFLNQMGFCKESLKEFSTAMSLYKKVLTIDSLNQTATRRLVNLQIKTEQYEDAYVLSEKFLSRGDSGNVDILKLNGISKFFTKRYKEAIALFNDLYEKGDGSYPVVRYLGLSYYKDRNYELAPEMLSLALAVDSMNLDTRFAMGVSCSKGNYKKEAIGHLEFVRDKLLPDESFLSLTYTELGEAFLRLGKHDQAIENRLLALEHSPGNVQKAIDHYELAYLFYRINEKEKALGHYRKSLDRLDSAELKKELTDQNDMSIPSFRASLKRSIEGLEQDLYKKNSADSLSELQTN